MCSVEAAPKEALFAEAGVRRLLDEDKLENEEPRLEASLGMA